MKQRQQTLWAALLLLLTGFLWLMPTQAWAYGNDYLEQQRNYSAMAMGVDRIHFKLPIYSRGTYDYYVGINDQGKSSVYYKLNNQKVTLFKYGSERASDGPSANDKKAYGVAWIEMCPNVGICYVTNIYTGVKERLTADEVQRRYEVKKSKESGNDDDYVTWLEIDWYPPVSLNKQTFSVGTHVYICKRYTGNVNYEFDWTLADQLTGQDNLIQAQLQTPYFYAVDGQGETGYGSAAVPYMVFYEPTKYTTSLSDHEIKTSDRAGNIIVATTDTVQEQFYATFEVYRGAKENNDLQPQVTTKVDIPAYHRIYDFAAEEEMDATGTYTGNNVLTWHVKNPHLGDLVEGDFFEIQRATKSDFSDAQQLDVVSMRRGEDEGEYSCPDDSREIWTGNAEVKYDTLRRKISTTLKDYELTDVNGVPLCRLDLKLTANNLANPSVPIYYRIRRASSSVWGWEHDLVHTATINKHNFLAPLAKEQQAYTLDPDYEKNRKVHFNLKLDNSVVELQPLYEDVTLEYTYKEFLGEEVQLEFNLDNVLKQDSRAAEYLGLHISIVYDGKVIQEKDIVKNETITVPVGSQLNYQYCYQYSVYTGRRTRSSVRTLNKNYKLSWKVNPAVLLYYFEPTWETQMSTGEKYRYSMVEEDLKKTLFKQLGTETSGLGRCMWDRTARLVLMRSNEMDGKYVEFVIPQDSIQRQEDGSWMASYTDVADKACTNYYYKVRIDQSNADLQLQDSAKLQPIALSGPSLYFNEAAQIRSFTASKGDAKGANKRGVLLKWVPTSAAVDEYVLTRVAKNSDASADTIYRGLDNSFFDVKAVPNVMYDYAVTARFECSGKYSENSATVEGWRSPYGEIAGSVLMANNTGMAGVQVALQDPDGKVVRSVTTTSTGTFYMDSLLYDLTKGSDYRLVPTAQYGIFSFNNTSAATANIRLSADNPVASGIDFMNTDCVRLTGRVLYKLTTIPVNGAMLLLNGDTVRYTKTPLKTGADGNFELQLTKNQPYVLQVIKEGHTFEGNGILHVEEGKDTFALSKPLDAVRFYDETKVRLVGRVAGGNDQRDLPEAFGLGTNNLGDDLQLVLQLEGDNTAQIVHDPDNLDRDSLHLTVDQMVYNTDPLSAVKERKVGETKVVLEKKRIIINPDPKTGEYAVDLFPTRYKVVQASARGYATLFSSGSGSESFDLTNAPLKHYNEMEDKDSTHYNAVYDRIYHTPIRVSMKQILYGLEQDGFGEPSVEVSSFSSKDHDKIDLYKVNEADETVEYLMGYPLYYNNRRYQFKVSAYEDYYYNNVTLGGKRDRVPQRGGIVTVHNGLHNTSNETTYELDIQGENRNVWLTVDHLDTENKGLGTLRTVSAALNVEGNTVETDVFQAYVLGEQIREKELRATESDITLLDIIRDPGGAGSSAWVESGTTYSFGYTSSFDLEVGLKLTPKYGVSTSSIIGGITAPQGFGTFMGMDNSSENVLSVDIPISHSWSFGQKYTYTMATTDRISTPSKSNKVGIGGNADVFVGATTSMISGKAKSVTVINDSLYQAKQPAIEAGTLLVHAKGVGADGRPYYLVTGEKVVLGTEVSHTFAYSQHYILNSVLPQLMRERENLLMFFNSKEDAQSAANQMGEPVYWYTDSLALNIVSAFSGGQYEMVLPEKSDKEYPDRIAALNNMIAKWVTIVYQNEEEKVMARINGKHVGTYSASYGNAINHSDSYTATYNYNQMPQGGSLISYEAKTSGAKALTSVLNGIDKIWTYLKQFDNKRFGKSAKEAYQSLFGEKDENGNTRPKNRNELGTVANSYKFSMDVSPIMNLNATDRNSTDLTFKKATGFTLSPDEQGDITVSVYRAAIDENWKEQTEDVTQHVELGNNDDALYGNYVFFTEAGSTYCLIEEEEKTKFYNEGTLLSNPTMAIAKPELSIDTYEMSNVPSDQRAKFRIQLRNNGQIPYGQASAGMAFSLSLKGETNPDGAKVYVNGAPLVQPLSYFLTPGQIVNQVMEVERGEVDDYNNLKLLMAVGDCPKNNSDLAFSVHFMPESSPVNIASPRQNWIMNTLSQRDSVGYYLPIDINGFDIHYKNFDHIEFQYKLSSESDDAWVNQCSFYADDSLYNLATGNKAMIENGRITSFRFYGERDPMEQQYDLRAVSFCRYGSGFVTKTSPVICGTKDTRPPRVFGEPEPANSILGVGDYLKLRFNEPIAGNYLDWDNNFQLMGATNEIGLTSSPSVIFNGTDDSYAASKVSRNMAGRSMSIDFMVKPADPYKDEVFFIHGDETNNVKIGKTADNRLYASNNETVIYSKPIEPMLNFTRVVVVNDKDSNTVRFYAGTLDVTDENVILPKTESSLYTTNAPLVFGRGFNGNMMETRIWYKALTAEEVAATNQHRLTGYEQELGAYYPMNEGRGDELTDRANGATLYMNGASWALQKGISLHLAQGDSVQLADRLLSRSDVYDASILMWFRTQSENGLLFRAGDDTWIGLENSKLKLRSKDQEWITTGAYNDNEWHHLVLAVNRTFNNVSLYVDGNQEKSFAATKMAGISGTMFLGGKGFEGNIDEVSFFEQALPKMLVEQYNNLSPAGDEMGLMGYLPFEEMKQNANGVMELVFSVNDRRQFRDPDGKVIDKVVPLVESEVKKEYADKNEFAPVHDHGQITKLNFDWAFNNDELLINLKMLDREINKQSLYVTVRDVEDLHGNPMPSPVTWLAFVDRNSLKWENKNSYAMIDTEWLDENTSVTFQNSIHNTSGQRHQFKLESLPDWLNVDQSYGTIEPQGEVTITFTYNQDMPVGTYSDLIYVTDENGLSEPMLAELIVSTTCPWSLVDTENYTQTMTIRAQVKIENPDGSSYYDNSTEDVVAAFCDGKLVARNNISSSNQSNKNYLYMTVYGNNTMNNKTVTFKLFRASTGKVYNLQPSQKILFKYNFMLGAAPDEPIELTTMMSENQQIALNQGWTWFSINLTPQPYSMINRLLTEDLGFHNGDLIKTPSDRKVSEFVVDETEARWVGTLNNVTPDNTFMINLQEPLTLSIEGNPLTDEQRTIKLDKGWNGVPYLLDEPMSVRDALADYYDKATIGDVIKSKTQFAVFSENKHWEGSLQTMKPGQGYLLKRIANETTTMRYVKNNTQRVARRMKVAAANNSTEETPFVNPNASSNMTVIAAVSNAERFNLEGSRVLAYVGNELAGIAQPQLVDGDTLFFVTISSDVADKVSFSLEQDGDVVGTTSPLFLNTADSHHGTLSLPVQLHFSQLSLSFPADVTYYSPTGQKVGEQRGVTSERQVSQYLDRLATNAGTYIVVVKGQTQTQTIKFMKK